MKIKLNQVDKIPYGKAEIEDLIRICVLLKTVYIEVYAKEGITFEFANFIEKRFSKEHIEKKANMKSEIEKCIAGKLFNSAAPEILKIIKRSRKLTHTYNAIDDQKHKKKRKVLKKLLGSIGKNVNIDVPFHCDYGIHIETGDNVIIGMNCTFVDCNKIIIGNNVLIASNVQIYTSTHPTNKNTRLNKNWKKEGLPFFRTFALPVKINDNVWIGGGVIILPGVEIGKNSIIGAGSLVNKSIPANSLAIGSPCKVIKNLKEEGK